MKPTSLLAGLSLTLSKALGSAIGPDFDPANATAWEIDYGYYPFRTYKSFNLISPEVRSAVTSPQCDDGLYTFLTPRGHSISDPGNVILDSRGSLVWAQRTKGQSYDFKPQTLNGSQYLSYWVGDDRIRGHGSGEYHIIDSSYQHQFRIKALNNLDADLHELLITDQGTALISIYQNVSLPHVSRQTEQEEFWIWDCLFQEIDIASNKLLFEWRASEHHQLDESYKARTDFGNASAPYDWFHINSVQKDQLGNYIISARYTHTVDYINGSDGSLLWVLGGKRNMFTDLSQGNATNFSWQHDARMHPVETFPETMDSSSHGARHGDGQLTQLLTMFDNAAEDHARDRDASRGLLLEMKYPDPSVPGAPYGKQARDLQSAADFTVKLIHDYVHPQHVLSSSQGSMQVMPAQEKNRDPKILLGYGFNAVYTEFDPNGTVLCDMRFATHYSWERGDVQSYRAYRMPWVGYPSEPPNAVVDASSHALWVSWNGATEVATWLLQHSSTGRQGDWSTLTTTAKTDFETKIKYNPKTTLHYVRIQARDAYERVLGETAVLDVKWTGVSGSMRLVFKTSADRFLRNSQRV